VDAECPEARLGQSGGPLPLAALSDLAAAAGQIPWPPEATFTGRTWADRTAH